MGLVLFFWQQKLKDLWSSLIFFVASSPIYSLVFCHKQNLDNIRRLNWFRKLSYRIEQMAFEVLLFQESATAAYFCIRYAFRAGGAFVPIKMNNNFYPSKGKHPHMTIIMRSFTCRSRKWAKQTNYVCLPIWRVHHKKLTGEYGRNYTDR